MKYLFLTKNRKNAGGFLVYLFTTFLFGIIVFGGLDAELNRSVGYNCNMLMGGWHPDVPTKVIEECRKRKNKGIVYHYDT